MSRRVHVVMIGLLVLWVLVMLAVGLAAVGVARADDGARVDARVVTISVPSGAWIEIYPVAGHRSSEVQYRCAGGRWRRASDAFYPRCGRVMLSARIWFDYAVVRGAQKDA